ncbi:hypothetical protein KUTeg_015230 [Tegillarca granosa]|uniref:Receptor ligand binding region domain-containing protein n=1 Tax=Tegillarca granosa TaxID=220873 RepID=A0ABQ9EPH9_TEGGR|nr:hypothetical protein KUTeg_015230 [Tegillarca granosa]
MPRPHKSCWLVKLGPACDEVCSAAGLLTGKWNIPMISYSCASTKLTDKELYPTFTMTSSLYSNVAYVVADILNKFHWNRVILAEGPEAIWRETAVHIQVGTVPPDHKLIEEKWLGDHIEEQWKNARDDWTDAFSNARAVVIQCLIVNDFLFIN